MARHFIVPNYGRSKQHPHCEERFEDLMPRILTTNAQIFCPHGGKGTTIPTDPIWQIDGGFVLLEGDSGTLTCPFVLVPCVGYTLRSMNLNATEINGRRVILETDFNQSFTGLPLVMTEIHRVSDDSTPAGIPPGTSPPPLSPALQDNVPPVVAASPLLVSYATTPAPVAPAVVTFTLAATYPMQWNLMLLDVNRKKSVDLTISDPPEVLVTPDGGQWDASPLTVVVTLSPLFLVQLGIGLHEIHMTGVSQRGKTGHVRVGLNIT